MENRSFDGASSDFKELKGCVIEEVHLSTDKTDLYFKVGADKWLKYSADGDCCSSSWFENVDVPSVGKIKVFEVLKREMPQDSWGLSGHECLAFYGWSLVTDKGYLDIEMRNSSNGYYGGSVCFAGELSPELDKKKKEEEEEVKKKEEEKLTIIRSIFNKMLEVSKFVDFKILVAVASPATILKLEVEIDKHAIGLKYISDEKKDVIQLYNHQGKCIVVRDDSKTSDGIDFMIPIDKVSHMFPYGIKK